MVDFKNGKASRKKNSVLISLTAEYTSFAMVRHTRAAASADKGDTTCCPLIDVTFVVHVSKSGFLGTPKSSAVSSNSWCNEASSAALNDNNKP